MRKKSAIKETIDLKSIKPNDQNPRFIRDEKFDKLCASIEKFPKMMELRPIIIDGESVVLGGNMRLRALTELGFKEIPATWVKMADELTEDEKRRFIIPDNSGFGEWDWDILANEWDVEDLKSWGVDTPVNWGAPENDPFDDDGIAPKNQYGVIVMCRDEGEQEETYNKLLGSGYNCKIVVT
nr:ParB N-terminal domain-containing protein [uncultured Draconibacterium sp.]